MFIWGDEIRDLGRLGSESIVEEWAIIDDIHRLKKNRNAIILSHVYQHGPIQDIADFVGDSLALSKKAVETDAQVIVFCGVHFMAETACILNPDKTVVLPRMDVGCDLADMATISQVNEKKRKYPRAAIVSYVNSSAEIKAVSDICCTSANAVEVVTSLQQEEIIFIPDKNLGSYVQEKTDKAIHLWDGYCYVHELISPSVIKELKKKYPSSEVIVHPECNKPVRDIADCIGGTSKMASYVKESSVDEFIVGTDDNYIHHLKKQNFNKSFYTVESGCRGMRRINLPDVKQALLEKKHIITVPKSIREKAYSALEKMMKVV